MKLLRLNLRLILRSWVFRLYLLLSIAGFVVLNLVLAKPALADNLYYSFRGMIYTQSAQFILTFCIGVYFAQVRYTTEECFRILPGQMRLARFLALIISSAFLLLLPLVFGLWDLISLRASLRYCLRYVIWVFTDQFSLLFLALALGFSAGSCSRSVFLYLLAAPALLLFTPVNESTVNTILKLPPEIAEKLRDLLTVGPRFLHGAAPEATGPMLDALYWLHTVFKLALGASLIAWCGAVGKRRRRFQVSASGLLSAAIASAVGFFVLYPTHYFTERRLMPDYHYDDYVSGYRITAYEGTVKIGEVCAIQCTLAVEPTGGGELILRLDSAFSGTFTCNGTLLHPERKDELLLFSAEELPDDGPFSISASYRGRVCYLSDLDSMDIFMTGDGLAAIPSSFALLPETLNDPLAHDYQLHIRGGIDLATNLEQQENVLSGNATTFCLFSGFFCEDVIDGIPITYLQANRQIDPLETLALAQSYGIWYNGEDKMQPSFEPFLPKKLLILYYSYGTYGVPVCYSDYGVCNPGLAQ